MLNPIAVAIPAFVVAIAAELGVAWRRGLLAQPTAAHPELRPFNTPSHHRVHHGINPKYIVATQVTQTALLESWRRARWMELFRVVWVAPGLTIYAALLWLDWQLSMSFGYGAQ